MSLTRRRSPDMAKIWSKNLSHWSAYTIRLVETHTWTQSPKLHEQSPKHFRYLPDYVHVCVFTIWSCGTQFVHRNTDNLEQFFFLYCSSLQELLSHQNLQAKKRNIILLIHWPLIIHTDLIHTASSGLADDSLTDDILTHRKACLSSVQERVLS